MSIEAKLQELSEAFNAFKTANDARIKAVETGRPSGDLEAKTEKLNEIVSRLEAELKQTQTAMNRTGGQGGAEQKTEKQEREEKYSIALNGYLRKGRELPAELKAMSVDSDEDGGFLVTPQMSSEIVKKVFESSPIRQLASVLTISTDSLEIIEDLDEVGSGWVGEQQARPETSTAKIKKIIIPAHELYANPKSSQKFLDDAAVNVESWLSDKVAEKFARDEATAFVSGDGVVKPRGFLTYDAGTSFNQVEQVAGGGSAAIVADDLINLQYSLKTAYDNGAVFLARRDAIKAFRKLKDSQNRYLWEPGLNGPAQSTLLGKPIYEAADIPAIASNALAVAYGNFKAGYQIVDRVGIRVLRDPYTAKPFVMFYSTKRVGGGVKNFEAIKLLKVGA